MGGIDSSIPVSVVIPARNAEATIGAQIAALRDQYDSSFEVILVDNASEDRTVKMARAAAGTMPITVVVESCQGSNRARNTGIAHASHQRIVMCDADDVIGEGWVKALGSRIEPGFWVSGLLDFEHLNCANTRTMRRRPSKHVGSTVEQSWGGNCGFTKSDWAAVGGFDGRISGWGDETEFFQRMRIAGMTGIAIPEAVVHYRLRPGARNLLRDEFRCGVSHEKIVRLGISRGRYTTFSVLGRLARIWVHIGLLSVTAWSLPRRSRHLAGIGYHAGRILGRWRHLEDDHS